MTKRQILASLAKIANELDDLGLHDEADNTTEIMQNIEHNKPDYDSSLFDSEQEQIKKEFNEGVEKILENLKLPMYDKNVLKKRIKAYLHWYYRYPWQTKQNKEFAERYNGDNEFFKGEAQIYNFLEHMLDKYDIEPKILNRMITRPIKMNQKYE